MAILRHAFVKPDHEAGDCFSWPFEPGEDEPDELKIFPRADDIGLDVYWLERP